MSMRFARLRSSSHCQLSSHTQVNEQVRPIVQFDDNPFAAAPDSIDPPTDKTRDPGILPWLPQLTTASTHGQNAPAAEQCPQIADDRLHFRQLRHCISSKDRWDYIICYGS